ncbi:amiloride-sensitive sodium channel subunit beta [Brachionus plicatilis]|uniref:Amiloride-sensitive sodium channel subunit beta n=1 Tax=Brachionus plicatilis TaxID=10195 RepID=A0A3M7QWG5_BRAPC|nr:amiloride-sensitive sodium channel subunit beta [Brachionus plicatilis]
MDYKKELKMNRKMTDVITEVILSSTGHGFPNIIKSTNISIKLMWIFFTAMSAGACGYMITESIINYSNYGVTTKTRILNENEPFFPTVTICNVNYFTSDLATKWIENYTFLYNYTNPLTNNFINEAISQSYKPVYQDIREAFGDSLQKLIVYCRFKSENCNHSQFEYFSHAHYGNCYQFNSGPKNLLTLISTEKEYGLRLVLNVSMHKDLKFMNPNLGAVVLIHNHTTYPSMVDPIAVSPKTETNIALSRTFYESQSKPFSKCDGKTNDVNSYDSEYYKIVHENTKGYSQTLCIYQCIQKFFIDECKCYVANFPCLYHSKSCNFFDDFNCSLQASTKLSEIDLINKECMEKCPLECEGMWFDKTISFSQFSNPMYEQSLSNYQGLDYVYSNKSVNSEDLAVVNIFYRNLGYVSITESPTTTVVSLFSNIGGIAGLFLGISVLTLVEVIEVLMKIIFIFKNKNKING